MGTGESLAGATRKCFEVCQKVPDCRFFSVTNSQACNACFIYKSCALPIDSTPTDKANYDIYVMVASGTNTVQKLKPLLLGGLTPVKFSASSASADLTKINAILGQPDRPNKDTTTDTVNYSGAFTIFGANHPTTPNALPTGQEWVTVPAGKTACQEIRHPETCSVKCQTGYAQLSAGTGATTGHCLHHNSRVTFGAQGGEPYLICRVSVCTASSTLLSAVSTVNGETRLFWKPQTGRTLTSKANVQTVSQGDCIVNAYDSLQNAKPLRCEADVYYGYYISAPSGAVSGATLGETNGDGSANDGQWTSECTNDNLSLTWAEGNPTVLPWTCTMASDKLVTHSQFVAWRGGSTTACAVTWGGGGLTTDKHSSVVAQVNARCLMECLSGYIKTAGTSEGWWNANGAMSNDCTWLVTRDRTDHHVIKNFLDKHIFPTCHAHARSSCCVLGGRNALYHTHTHVARVRERFSKKFGRCN